MVFGATVAGRPPELPGVESMVGLLMNTVPVRVRLDPAQTLGALLARIQDQQSAMLPHTYLGLADIQRLAGHGELFDTAVVFENIPVGDQGFGTEGQGGLRIAPHGATDGMVVAHYPLSMAVFPGEQLRLDLYYRPDLVDAATAARHLDRLRELLESFIRFPHRLISRFDPLPAAERDRLLTQWNATACPGIEATLPGLFQAQAARTPGATAVICGGQSLTYAELDARPAGWPGC